VEIETKEEKFEGTKVVIRCHHSKNRQYNGPNKGTKIQR